MKRKLLITMLGVLFVYPHLYAQEKKDINIEAKNAYAEKIYLQPVSTVFTTDKTIWFKAIVTDLEHLATKLSNILHVDLIDFDENIIDSKLLKIENGVADGYFDLHEKLPSGKYLIRAYTEWNKNFGREFISQTYVDLYAPKEVKEEDQVIREVVLQETENQQYQISAKAYPKLLNPKFRGDFKMLIHTEGKTDSVVVKEDKNDNYSFQYLLPKDAVNARMELKLDSVRSINFDYKQFNTSSKTVTVNKEYLDLQFFPEGGKLVNGLKSKVAFKALDYRNKGKEVFGNIVDQDNNIIMPFKTNNLGMGVTYLTPNFQKNYYASVTGKDNVVYKYPLPSVHKTGVVIGIKEIEEFIVVSLQNKNILQEQLHVKAQVRGVLYDEFDVVFKDHKVSAGIEKRVLPEGIVKFTVTNQENQIVAERLFFNYKEEERVNISTRLNKKQYHQRDKTVLNLKLIDNDSNTIPSNVSVLVINKEQLGKENSLRSNILSYFLLNSELRGKIENPNHYFNPQNKNRKDDMDALLLSQGWSNYKYENSLFSTKFKHLPEKELTISGSIRSIWSSKKELKKPVELTAVYGPLNVDIREIDSTGRFKIGLEDYYKNEFRVALQTKNKKGNKKDYTIELDYYKMPKINYIKEEKVFLADSVSVFVKENILRKQKEENIKLADDVIELDEIELTGYKLTPQREKVMELHGLPDIVVENEELMTKAPKWHSGFFNVIEVCFPNIFNRIDNVFFNQTVRGDVRMLRTVYYLVDGILVHEDDYNLLFNMPLEDIKSVELLKKPKGARAYFGQNTRFFNPEFQLDADPESTRDSDMAVLNARITILSVYTYGGKGIRYLSRNKGIDKFNIQGFEPKREFYSPKYNIENDLNVPDFRSVVHWEPNVNTNEKGEAKIEYYNADNTGDLLIVIEGINKKGKFGYYETSYQVEEK
ncbi:hypothetical protein AXE80_07070 [Wenyingzhuangia fucanilytica]|uniref:Macroglobulin domain-containing protein n=1 Tax=Wenyingzhuangia fucanilytica TaxID=1790137 RepID=A0A1B1Y5J2_9FLAO|nr:hypothetical protein [Wenyingzhuangia fucanilytica]ANW96051.1 hypothetical protein AXE80_07070 [Wenyingzhuangia fucanilytica]